MTKKDPNAPALMSTDRPLDALLPELREAYEPIPYAPVHQRVLEVDTGDGYEWVFACWEDPGGARALNAALRDLIEATLLAHLSHPPSADPATLARPFRRLRLYCFAPIDGPLPQAVQPFGFAPAPYQPEQHTARMAALADEAKRMGRRLPLSPHSLWVAEVAPAPALLQDLQRDLTAALGPDLWGQHPGKPSHALAQALYARGGASARPITPDLKGLRALESLIISQSRGRVRWLPPLVFQALCDLIGVVMAHEWGYDLQWAVCDQDPLGLYPPPHFRLAPPSPDAQPEHFLVGQQVLQWCVMPLLPGEQVPPLTEWLAHTFGQALTTRIH